MNKNSPALLLLGRLGASGLALISAPIVARAIGPEGRGETAATIALFALIPVLVGLGLPLEMRRVVATDNTLASVRRARRLVVFSLVMSVPASFICWMTIFGSFDFEARLAASIGVALTPLTLSWICDTSVLVATRDYVGIAVLQLLQPASYLVLVTVLWVAGSAETATVICAYILSNTASFVFGIIRVRHGNAEGARAARDLVKGSLSFAGGSLAEAASNRLDQVVALPLIGAVQSGLYSVAVTVAFAPLAIAQALGAATFTGIARAEGSQRKCLIDQSLRQVASVSIVSSGTVWLTGPFLVTFLFGEAFAGASTAIQVSAGACFASSVALQASSVLVAGGRRLLLTVSQGVSLVIAIGFLFLLGPANGADGAAWAALIGSVVLAVLNILFCGASLHSWVPTPQAFLSATKTLIRSKQN